MNLDTARIKASIMKEFQRQHKLGESAGGTEHLSFTSVTRLDPGTPRGIKYGTQDAFEIPFTIETYTETEFEHSPEDDEYYKHKYVGKIVLDGAMNVLDFYSASP